MKTHFMKASGVTQTPEGILCGIGGEKYKSKIPYSTDIRDVNCNTSIYLYNRIMKKHYGSDFTPVPKIEKGEM